jgi:subtilisin family serine protease
MARRSTRSRSASARSRGTISQPPASPPPPTGAPTEPPGEFTGRYLVLLRDDGVSEGLEALKSSAGLKEVCNAADFAAGEVEMSEAGDAEVFVLDKLKVAVVRADPSQAQSLSAAAAEDSAILAVEPERIMYALQQFEPAEQPPAGPLPLHYLRGYRDAVNHLYDALTGAGPELAEVGIAAAFSDNAQFTWGLQATKVNQSRFTGRGVRVAVLDTGMDLAHPDYAGRTITNRSFVAGEPVQDGNGHGTHCIGTALGPKSPATGVRRYGCASTGSIFAGKVLSNAGSGADNGILAGINWAITNQCRIISMSLGARVQPGEPFSQIYEAVAQRALQSRPGTLIIAASGNDSRSPTGGRREPPAPVGRPANCPSIMAVAALDSSLRLAPFSNGGINPNGGGVDIAGPGVNVFSSFPVSRGTHGSISGTSMATPHVAGIAAMWLEARGNATSAQALWQLLTGNALRLPLPSRDVGAGLVQAPV